MDLVSKPVFWPNYVTFLQRPNSQNYYNKVKQLILGKCYVTENITRASEIPVCLINNKANSQTSLEVSNKFLNVV
jgi:hypothetical protein